MKATKLLLFITLLGLFLGGCKKDDKESPVAAVDNDTQSVTDNARLESEFEGSRKVAEDAMMRNVGTATSSQYYYLPNCAHVSVDLTNKLITVYFADSSNTSDNMNCACNEIDGRKRRGTVRIAYTGAYQDVGSVITVTHDNYYVNNNKLEGTKTITNKGDTDGDTHTEHEIKIQNGKITFTDNTFITWESTRTREWVAGESTSTVLTDDAYEISGNGNGLNRNGQSYTLNITSPLYISMDCYYIKSGRIELTPNGKTTRVIDYGNGTCDNKLTVSIGSFSAEVTIP